MQEEISEQRYRVRARAINPVAEKVAQAGQRVARVAQSMTRFSTMYGYVDDDAYRMEQQMENAIREMEAAIATIRAQFGFVEG